MPEQLPVLSRPRDGAMLGGVCAGLARRWQVDPNLLRIAIAVLAVFGGLGVVAYGVGLLLMPRDGQAEMPIRRLLPFTRTWPTVFVVGATLAVAALLTGLTSSGIGLGPLAVIVGVWFFGFRHNGSRPIAPPPEPTPFERQAEAWRVRLAEQQVPGFVVAAPVAGETVQRWTQPYTDPRDLTVKDNLPPALIADRRRRTRPWLVAGVAAGLGVLAVTVLGVVLGLPTAPLPYVAVILAALGLGLVAATKGGRPRLLLPATILSGIATLGLMLPTPSTGEITQAYTDPATLPASVELDAGAVNLDLSGLRLDADRDLRIKVGAGEVNLTLPAAASTIVSYHIGAGEFRDPTSRREGLELNDSRTFAAGGAGPALHVDVELDVGEMQVRT